MTRIRGTNGNDRIDQNGVPALDIKALGGNDTIVLDRSDDLGGDNRVNAGGGNDTVVNSFEGGNVILLGRGDDVYVGTGFSTLGGSDGVDGGAGNDQFLLQTLKSAYFGGTGDDLFVSDGWENTINGAGGDDTISYQFRHENSTIGGEGVAIDLLSGFAQTGAARFETLTSIENAIGSERADSVQGTEGDNRLAGLAGNDQIFGLGGDDLINGGLGTDTLSGSAGADHFVYANAAEAGINSLNPFAIETILDFDGTAGDRIDLSLMQGSDRFTFIGGGAFTAGGHGEIHFAGGMVQIDADGDGTADMFIKMTGVTSMQNTDFLV
jgi:Ca2+-binding RTX toxin-like protein